jgi:hypothetical protein
MIAQPYLQGRGWTAAAGLGHLPLVITEHGWHPARRPENYFAADVRITAVRLPSDSGQGE